MRAFFWGVFFGPLVVSVFQQLELIIIMQVTPGSGFYWEMIVNPPPPDPPKVQLVSAQVLLTSVIRLLGGGGAGRRTRLDVPSEIVSASCARAA